MRRPAFAAGPRRIRFAREFVPTGRRSRLRLALGGVAALVTSIALVVAAAACSAPSASEVEHGLLAIPRQAPAREHGLERRAIPADLGRAPCKEELVFLRAGPAVGAPSRGTIVLVHGTPGSSLCWTPIVFGSDGAPGLADEHEVLALELVGHGFASPRGAPYSFQRCADWLGDALVALDLDDVVLVGHSYGGEVAWRAALDHPERVRGLVLVDSAGWERAPGGWLPEEEALRGLPFAELGWTISSQARIRSALDPHFAEGAPDDLVEELYLACARPDTWRAMVELARDEEGGRQDEIASLALPALLLWGSEDLAYPVESVARRFERALPNAELVVFEGAGHYPQEERPAEFVRALAAFVDALEEPPGPRPEIREGEPGVAWGALAARGHDPRAFLPDSLGEGDALPFARRLARTRVALALDASDGTRELGLGDLLLRVERDPASLEPLLAALARSPDPEAATFALLLDRRRLRSPDWDPERSVEGDGIVLGPVLDRAELGAPWDEAEGTGDLLQALVLAPVDLAAWLDGQADFARYPEDVGARYESVRPRAGSRVRGRGPEGRPFDGLVVDVRADLPFPFGGYSMPLGIFCRLDAAGELVTEVHAECDDFLWLRGQDRVLPLRASDGEPAGVLVVRRYGFDLAGVPEGRSQREAALRSSLGNLVLRAERAAAASGARLGALSGVLPEYRVTGAR